MVTEYDIHPLPKIPFPGSHPTNPPLSHTRINPLQPSGTIPNIPEPCPTLGVTEDDNTVSDFEDDEEVNENGPWTHTPALAG